MGQTPMEPLAHPALRGSPSLSPSLSPPLWQLVPLGDNTESHESVPQPGDKLPPPPPAQAEPRAARWRLNWERRWAELG